MKEPPKTPTPSDSILACDHGIVFNERTARELSPRAVRRMFPRLEGLCPKGCGFAGIAYASTAHYLYGDW